MKSVDYEAGIVGGGPAGSAAALNLSAAGITAAVFEKKQYPREVLCGEFLSREVIDGIAKWGCIDNFFSLEHNKITDFSLINGRGTEYGSPLNFTAAAMKRSIFDEFLLKEAANKGAVIFQSFNVIEIRQTDGIFRISGKLNGESKEYKVRYLIGAWGKQNILDKKLGRGFSGVRSGLNGIKFHIDKKYLNGLKNNRIYIYSSRGAYCGINSVSKNTASICFLELNKTGSSVERKIISLKESNPGLNEIMSNEFIGEVLKGPVYGTGNIYFGRREHVVNNILMIGDSAGMIAPFTGDGIGMAFESARLAVDYIMRARKENWNPEVLAANYISAYRVNFSKRIRTALFIQHLMLRGAGERAGFILKIIPSLIPFIIRNTRGI